MHQLEIESLHARPELASLLARWTYDEWYRDRSIEFEFLLRAFLLRTKNDSLPLSLVCLCDTVPAGMVTLKRDDLWSRTDLNPWLSSLYVAPEFRNRGVGRELIVAVTGAARERGYRELYLFLGTSRQEWLERYYRRRGWEIADPALDNDGNETKIMRFLIA